MSCYFTSRLVASCHVMSCQSSRHVLSCHVVSRNVIFISIVTTRRVMSCHVVSIVTRRNVMQPLVMTYATSRHVTSRRVVSCRIMTWHGMAWHGLAQLSFGLCDIGLLSADVHRATSVATAVDKPTDRPFASCVVERTPRGQAKLFFAALALVWCWRWFRHKTSVSATSLW